MRQTKQKASKYPLLKALTAPTPQPMDWEMLDETSHHIHSNGAMVRTIRHRIATQEVSIEAIRLDADLVEVLESNEKIRNMSNQTWCLAQTFKKIRDDDNIANKVRYYTYQDMGYVHETMMFYDSSAQVEADYKFIVYTLTSKHNHSAVGCTYITFTEMDDPLSVGALGVLKASGVRQLMNLSPHHDEHFDGELVKKLSLGAIREIVRYNLWKELFQETITTTSLPVYTKKANLGFKINKQFKVTMLLDHIEDRRTLVNQFIRDSHIRLQRYGKGNRLVKPVLIKSTTVKAHIRK